LRHVFFLFRWFRKSYGSGTVQNGINTPATVLRIWDTGTTVNKNPLVGFQLEVMPPGGQTFQVECQKMISRLDMGSFNVGTQVTVS
jgi:hypothetical protein